MDKVNLIPNPDCIDIHNDPDVAHQALPPMQIAGTSYYPATSADIGNLTIDGVGMVSLMLGLGPNGLQLVLTPEGARQWSAAVLLTADKADEFNRSAANAQLDKALRKGSGHA